MWVTANALRYAHIGYIAPILIRERGPTTQIKLEPNKSSNSCPVSNGGKKKRKRKNKSMH